MCWLGLRTYLGTRRMRRRAFTEMVLPKDFLSAADRDAWAETMAPVFGHDLADHPPVVMKQLAAMRAYDATSRLAELSGKPSLIVGARHDLIARPEVVRALAAGISGARLVEFEDAAHGVTIQSADRVNALLEEHFMALERPQACSPVQPAD
jgi:pimeloyl-ACP methyl ester carboxylesterase